MFFYNHWAQNTSSARMMAANRNRKNNAKDFLLLLSDNY